MSELPLSELPVSELPTVDVNLFVHNGANTVAAAIDSVLAQSWPALTLTLIDDGSSDATAEILHAYAAHYPAIRLKRNRVNCGAVGAFQRGLWLGDADYVMPKSADDLIAPDFVARLMDVLLAHPDCVMCHAGGLCFTGAGQVRFEYPAAHRLHAVAASPIERAATVMAHYTSSPSFWGIYRRHAVDGLASIGYNAGWDHVVLAELALAGEIRHVPEILYWRRNGGRPVADLARASTREAIRGIGLDHAGADLMWMMPYITTAFAHLENFNQVRLDSDSRALLMAQAVAIFQARWAEPMAAEAAAFVNRLPALLARQAACEPGQVGVARCQIGRALAAVETLVPQIAKAACRQIRLQPKPVGWSNAA